MNIKVKYATMIVKGMAESIRFYTEVMGFKTDSHYNPRPGVHCENTD
ncbi:MAG TPA: VOC family protein [Bacillota bacterium]|nr:VOC family protein [Bacillota bacterium]